MSEKTVAEMMKVVFPQHKEELINFINRCKSNNSRTMLSPKCNSVYDKKTTKEIEAVRAVRPRSGRTIERTYRFVFNKRGVTQRTQLSQEKAKFPYQRTFVSPKNAPTNKWGSKQEVESS